MRHCYFLDKASELLYRVSYMLHHHEAFHSEIIGTSQAIRRLRERIDLFAPLDSTVLICGESGTGKELVARAIHAKSDRAGKPFIAVNCSALPESLVESELFGHERGAFTGAHALALGKFALADGGSAFLDEIGEMPLPIQPKLLRVIQERSFERVGGTRPISVDIRLIAATNRHLDEAVADGLFRDDLYYRLNVFLIKTPSLRERRGDILVLANHFLLQFAKKHRRAVCGISPEAQKILEKFEWPGNVRQLENMMEQAVAVARTNEILPDDISEHLLSNPYRMESRRRNYHQSLDDQRTQLALNAVYVCRGNVAAAARMLGLHRSNLHRLLKEKNGIHRKTRNTGTL